MTGSRLIDVLLLLTAVSATAPLSGCATLVKGSSQSVIVTTDPSGAICTLTRKGKEIAIVNPTPGTITVDKSKNAVAVSCNKAGYLESAGTINSEFQAMTFGNILFGGLVGVAIDAGSGAMNQYEPSITLTLIPAEFSSEAERDALFDKMKTEFLAQSDQAVERIKKKCSGSACDSQLKAAASAKEGSLCRPLRTCRPSWQRSRPSVSWPRSTANPKPGFQPRRLVSPLPPPSSQLSRRPLRLWRRAA